VRVLFFFFFFFFSYASNQDEFARRAQACSQTSAAEAMLSDRSTAMDNALQFRELKKHEKDRCGGMFFFFMLAGLILDDSFAFYFFFFPADYPNSMLHS
jgi:hypothetical protein